MVGDDDIFWVSQLHGGLMAAGFYPSDEEVENWVFGEGTQGALLMFQACNNVAETGSCVVYLACGNRHVQPLSYVAGVGVQQ
jgi:hypothetical protein